MSEVVLHLCQKSRLETRVYWRHISDYFSDILAPHSLVPRETDRLYRRFIRLDWKDVTLGEKVVVLEKLEGSRVDMRTSHKLSCLETPASGRSWPENGLKRHKKRRRKRISCSEEWKLLLSDTLTAWKNRLTETAKTRQGSAEIEWLIE